VFGVATACALGGVVLVAAAVLLGRPADPRRVLRLGAAAIVVGTAGLLTPLVVQDAGAAAWYLLGVPVAAALAALPAPRTGAVGRIVDLLAGAVIGGWGLLLALGVGAAFLPPALLYLGSAVVAAVSRSRRSPQRAADGQRRSF